MKGLLGLFCRISNGCKFPPEVIYIYIRGQNQKFLRIKGPFSWSPSGKPNDFPCLLMLDSIPGALKALEEAFQTMRPQGRFQFIDLDGATDRRFMNS